MRSNRLVVRQGRLSLLHQVGALVESLSLSPNHTGRENLEVTRRLIGGRAEQIKRVLRIVRLEDAAGRRVRGYSHGMRQRMGLALVLLNEPELLILDEPTNGLDPSGIQEMRELIYSLPDEYNMVLSGLGLRAWTPGLGFEAPLPWLQFLRHVALAYLASWLTVSIHTWVGLRWHSFVVASAVGVGAMVIAVVLLQSDYSQWYPWTLSGVITYSLAEGLEPWAELAVGSPGGLVVAFLGGWDVTRRDVL